MSQPTLEQRVDRAVLTECLNLSISIKQSLISLHLRFPGYDFHALEVDEEGNISFDWTESEGGETV